MTPIHRCGTKYHLAVETVSKLRNPTHGSGWMVQVRATNSGDRVFESHPRQWVDCSDPACGDR
ncbi:MAG TPA: hypothetical protein VGJ48_03600, partial [Pyrinomonadaceae bacterium]